MIVMLSEPWAYMPPFHVPWYTISQDIMGSLDIERLLDLGVRRKEKVSEDDSWDEESEGCVYSLRSA